MMTTQEQIAQLVEGYRTGELTETVMLDNDAVYLPEPGHLGITAEIHPYDLLTGLLGYLGIPHENV